MGRWRNHAGLLAGGGPHAGLLTGGYIASRTASTLATIEVYSLFGCIDFGCSLSRARFEVLSMYYFRNSMGPVEMSLCGSGIDKTLSCSLLLVQDCKSVATFA